VTAQQQVAFAKEKIRGLRRDHRKTLQRQGIYVNSNFAQSAGTTPLAAAAIGHLELA
jgi:hypothetical protein